MENRLIFFFNNDSIVGHDVHFDKYEDFEKALLNKNPSRWFKECSGS